MKHAWRIVFLLLVAGVAVLGAWMEASLRPARSVAGAAEAAKSGVSKLPPLKVDKGAPLLLLEEPKKKTGDDPITPPADNESCFVCHGDYREEELAGQHAKVNVGCVKCHGLSHAHRDDEDNITPPDVMFASDKIEAGCKKCHDTHDASVLKVITMWRKRCPEKTDPEDILCTDCHGFHRRPFRTVRWDKNTGKLLSKQEPPVAKPAKGQSESKSGALVQ